MIQKKEPAAGEWWRHITGGGIVFIIGQDVNGDPVAHDDDGDAWNIDLQSYEHLPECTGWDWPPAETTTIEVSPGDGWRWLEDNEWICSEDEYFAMGVGQFFKVSDSVGELASLLRKLGCPARRRIPTTRTIKLCSVVYWDRPEAPMSTILTEQELERHRKAWRTMHVVSETTVEVPL